MRLECGSRVTIEGQRGEWVVRSIVDFENTLYVTARRDNGRPEIIYGRAEICTARKFVRLVRPKK